MDIYANGEVITDDDTWIYDYFEWSYISPKLIRNALENNDDEVNIYINSPGGDVSAASEIRSMLLSSSKKTKAIITGMCASAATVIMTGTDSVEAYSTSILMVHKASTWMSGNADDMQAAKDMLDTVDKAIANAYVAKTGKTKDEVLQIMKNTTWMEPEKALADGFIDKIIDGEPEQEELKVTASFGFKITDSFKTKFASLKASLKQTTKPVENIDVDKIADTVIRRLQDKKIEEEQKQQEKEISDLQAYAARMGEKYVQV